MTVPSDDSHQEDMEALLRTSGTPAKEDCTEFSAEVDTEDRVSGSLAKIAEESARGSFFLAVGRTASILISAASIFIIARIMGPEQYGLYSISTVIPSLLVLAANPGIDQGIIRYAASLRAKGEEHRIARMLRHGLSLKILLGLIATLVCYIFSEQFAGQILSRPEIAPYIQLASLLIILQTVCTIINSTLVGLDKTESNALITGSEATVKALTSSLLVVLGLGIFGALLGYIVGSLVASVLGIFVFYRIYSLLGRNSDMGGEDFLRNVGLLVRYGYPLYLSTLLGGIVLQYRSILLAVFTSTDDVGNFQAASNFNVLVSTLCTSIATALLTAFSKLEQQNDEARRFLKLSIKYASMIVAPMVTFIILYSEEMVGVIYGQSYRTAPYFLSLGAIQFYSIGVGYLILNSLFNGLGDTKTTFKLSLIGSFTYLLLAPPMIWSLKVPGAIIATLISTLLASAYGLSAAKSKLNIEIEADSIARTYVASLLPVIPLIALQNILPLTAVAQLIIGASIYFTTYLTLAPIMKVVTLPEIEEAKTILNKTKPLRVIAKPLFYFVETLLSKMQ